jgi:hypothetical protein
MIDSQNLKTQTSYSLKLHDVRKAAAAYELMHSAAAMLQMLPVPVLEVYRAVPIERCAHEGRPSSTALSGIGPSHSASGGSLDSR